MIKPILKPAIPVCALLAAASLLTACGKSGSKSKSGNTASADTLLSSLASAEETNAAAEFTSPDGTKIGYAVFTDAPGGNVLLRIDLQGLSQGWHGIHLHQVGDCSDGDAGFKASGGHINPDKNEHGLLNPAGSERADISNIYAHSDGRATAEIFRTQVSLYPSEESAAINGPYPLLDDDGFAVVVHANRDDHKTQPIGGAGGRIACAAFEG